MNREKTVLACTFVPILTMSWTQNTSDPHCEAAWYPYGPPFHISFAKEHPKTHLVAHVERQSDHAKVVDDENSLEVEGFAVLHYPGPQWRDKVNVCYNDERLGHRGRHEEPVPRAPVCNRDMLTGLWGQRSDTKMHCGEAETDPRLMIVEGRQWQTCHKATFHGQRLTCILDELIVHERGRGLYIAEFHFQIWFLQFT